MLGVGVPNEVQDAWPVALEQLTQRACIAAALDNSPPPVVCKALLHGGGLVVGAWEWGTVGLADKDERVDLGVDCCERHACDRRQRLEAPLIAPLEASLEASLEV